MANFSSKKLIQDTGRKMGLATTVKRAQKRDPSEKTFFDKKRGKYHYDSSVFPYICTAVIKGKWNYNEYKKELFEIFYKKKFNFFSYYLSRFKF